MRRRLGRKLAVLVWAISLAQPAEAQRQRIFAGAGVIADNDQTNSSLTEVVPDIRTIYFPLSDSPHPYIIRPGIGLRWRF